MSIAHDVLLPQTKGIPSFPFRVCALAGARGILEWISGLDVIFEAFCCGVISAIAWSSNWI